MARCIRNWLGLLTGGALLRKPDLAKRRVRVLASLVSEACVSIGNHRLRTFLAILGIVIGVGSVVLLLGIGTASQHRVERTIIALGSNLLIVTPRANVAALTSRHDFTAREVDALAELPLAETVAYSSFASSKTAFSKSRSVQTQLIGTIPEYLFIRNWVLGDGSVFSSDDVRQGARVVVIGKSLAQQLFEQDNPLGRSLFIGESRMRFQIVGILEPKGPGFNGQDQDNVAFLPISTFKTFFGNPYGGVIKIIYVKARSADALGDLTDAIRTALRQLHKLSEVQQDDFNIENVNAVLQVASETTQAFSTLLTAIASISLLVGGIGIMNIMLVTVSERTREIGIRKAIGATQQHILIQFLLEAVIISAAGSLAGLVAGLAVGLIAEAWMSLPMEFNPWSVVLALGMSLGVGLPSGLYPALRASRLEPIDALRAVA